MTDPDTNAAGMWTDPADWRTIALERAVQATAKGTRPDVILQLAHRFEIYMKAGNQVAQPTGPLLPPSLVAQAIKVPGDTLYVTELVLGERLRQIAKGYDADSDDLHDDGTMADAAAAAIMRGSGPDGAASWVDQPFSRIDELIGGIALAFAELERIHRANDRINEQDLRDRAALEAIEQRTHGDDSAINDEAPLPYAKPTLVPTALPLDEPTGMPLGEPTIDDLHDMYHALGSPADPLRATFRNYFMTYETNHEARRFRELPECWTVRKGADGSVWASVTDAGRILLAATMEHHPDDFTDRKDNRKAKVVCGDEGDAA